MDMSNTAENKRIVQEGLKRRNDRLEAFENEMIRTCNQNHADALEQRQKDTETLAIRIVSDEERKARARERLKAMQTAQKQERDVTRALNAYLTTIVGLLLLAAVTPLPYWSAVITMLGLGVILLAHIYRIYVPLQQEMDQNKTH